MSAILFRNGKIVGEVSKWENAQVPAEYREVLGKRVLVGESNERCSFISPKPVNKKDKLAIIFNEETKLVLEISKVLHGLNVTAVIKERIPYVRSAKDGV